MNIRRMMFVSSYITIYGARTAAVLPSLGATLCHPAECHCSLRRRPPQHRSTDILPSEFFSVREMRLRSAALTSCILNATCLVAICPQDRHLPRVFSSAEISWWRFSGTSPQNCCPPESASYGLDNVKICIVIPLLPPPEYARHSWTPLSMSFGIP